MALFPLWLSGGGRRGVPALLRSSLSFSLSENSNSIRLEKHEQRFFLVPDRCARIQFGRRGRARKRKKSRAEIQTRIFDARAHVPPFDRVSDGVHSRFSARVLKQRVCFFLFFLPCLLRFVCFKRYSGSILTPLSLSLKYARATKKQRRRKQGDSNKKKKKK